jgi:hypothetical protein
MARIADGAALMPAHSPLALPGRPCEGQNESTPEFQERMPFSCGLFDRIPSDVSSLLLLAQCMP